MNEGIHVKLLGDVVIERTVNELPADGRLYHRTSDHIRDRFVQSKSQPDGTVLFDFEGTEEFDPKLHSHIY